MASFRFVPEQERVRTNFSVLDYFGLTQGSQEGLGSWEVNFLVGEIVDPL